MRAETMTSMERLEAALHLDKPDRVPIVPNLFCLGVASLAGYTQAQLAWDQDLYVEAYLKVFDDFGGWDGYSSYTSNMPDLAKGDAPLAILLPGRELPDDYVPQYVEKEVLQIEDYDKICEMGFKRFYSDDYVSRISQFAPEELARLTDEALIAKVRLSQELDRRGAVLYRGEVPHPFLTLSLARSIVKFTEDLYFRPEMVERTIRRMTDDLIAEQLQFCREIGATRWLMSEERAGALFYPRAVTERFWWPYTQEIASALWSEGILTGFHLDTCWDKNLPDFRSKLPKGSYFLELDGTTDIFAAKEVLRGHGALKGDVSAALFTVGRREEMKAYVKRLIDEVGGDGGFVLSAGCSLPPHTKPENLRAFLETGKTYELSKK